MLNISPPPPQPFTTLSPSNSICLSNSKVPQNLLCMRPGRYSTSTGAFGYSTTDLDTLASFDTSSNISGSLLNPTRLNPYNDYTSPYVFGNVKASSALQKAMHTATTQKRTFNISISAEAAPKVAPMMCVFSEINHSGDFWCLGVGGTNFTSNLVNKIASLTMSPGLAARLYPGWYGNPLDTFVSTDIADLSELVSWISLCHIFIPLYLCIHSPQILSALPSPSPRLHLTPTTGHGNTNTLPSSHTSRVEKGKISRTTLLQRGFIKMERRNN